LEWLLKRKQREKEEEAMYMEDTHTKRLVIENEMVRVVLHLVSRSERRINI
jgi:hypothetical protein